MIKSVRMWTLGKGKQKLEENTSFCSVYLHLISIRNAQWKVLNCSFDKKKVSQSNLISTQTNEAFHMIVRLPIIVHGSQCILIHWVIIKSCFQLGMRVNANIFWIRKDGQEKNRLCFCLANFKLLLAILWISSTPLHFSTHSVTTEENAATEKK
jgi:hypothetical protein